MRKLFAKQNNILNMQSMSRFLDCKARDMFSCPLDTSKASMFLAIPRKQDWAQSPIHIKSNKSTQTDPNCSEDSLSPNQPKTGHILTHITALAIKMFLLIFHILPLCSSTVRLFPSFHCICQAAICKQHCTIHPRHLQTPQCNPCEHSCNTSVTSGTWKSSLCESSSN